MQNGVRVLTKQAYAAAAQGRNRGKTYPRFKKHHIRDQLLGEAVVGIAPVQCALYAQRRELHALYLQEATRHSQSAATPRKRQIIDSANALSVPVHYVSKEELSLAANGPVHQGCMLDASPLDFVHVHSVPDDTATPPTVVLDECTDPRNFGACIRTAHFMGANVLTCARNSAPLSPAASKASAGAIELTQVFSTKQLPKFLAAARDMYNWDVIAAYRDDAAIPAHRLTPAPNATGCAIVLGSEGEGLRTNTWKSCSRSAYIESSESASPLVDSLNLSVAMSVLLHRLLH